MSRTHLRLVAENEGHRVTNLELFFDLVFVYAITQVTQLMADHLTPLGLGQGLVMLGALWWCWCSYTWLGNTVHADVGPARAAMFTAMALMFLISLCIPEAFTDLPGGLYAPLVFVGCFLAVRLLHLLALLRAAHGDPALRGSVLRMGATMLACVAVLAGAAFTGGGLQLGLWALALLVDYLGVYRSSSGGWRLPAPEHFAERFGLIVIIALGESIVAIGIGIGSFPITGLIAVAAVAGVGLAGALWWMYFDVVARISGRRLHAATGRERIRLATDSYTYLHLPLVAGIVLTALGLKKALLYIADTERHTAAEGVHGLAIWALTGGVALYLVGLSALRRRNLGRWNRQRLVLAAALLALTPLLQGLPATLLVVVVALAVAAVVTYEAVRFAPWRRETHATG